MRDPVARTAAKTPDRIGLIDATSDDSWTFDAYDTKIESDARILAGQGVAAGDRVAILSETHPAVASLFFACWRIGAIAVPLNARLAPVELREQIERVDPKLVITTPPHIDDATAATSPDYTVRVLGGAVEGFTPLAAADETPYQDPSTTRETDVALLFTSGTTGEPKAVRLTAGNFRAAAHAHRERFGVRDDDRWLCPLSTYHMGGLAIIVRSAFYGTTAVLMDTAAGFDPLRAREALAEYDCTAISLVPVMLRRLLDSDDGPMPGSLRFVLSGGAPTATDLVEDAHERGVPVCPTYGMTETTSQVATPTPDVAARFPDSVGRPLPGVDVVLRHDDGAPVDAGELGEIVVSGPTVTPGYLHGGGTFDAAGFHTGDIARRAEDGRLYVLHRREDRILTGGENVHPGEVVDVLHEHPDVVDAVVLGLPDAEWGERVSALVVPEPTATLDAEALGGYARDRLAAYKVPRTIAFTDDLPRTASGTVDRTAARDELRRLTDI